MLQGFRFLKPSQRMAEDITRIEIALERLEQALREARDAQDE